MVKQTIAITIDTVGGSDDVKKAITSAQKALLRLLDVALPGVTLGKTTLPVSLYAGENVESGDYSVTLTLSETPSKDPENGT